MTIAVSDPDEVARLKAELAVARAELTGAKLLIEQLKAQLAVLRRMSFGRSAEKLTAEIIQLELLLEDLEEGEAERVAPAAGPAPGEPARRHPVRRPLPPHLPREEVLHHPGDACPGCGGTSLSKLGEDITEVLERIPAQLKVIRHIRPRLSCRACETIIQAPAPDLPIEKGRPGPVLIANIVVGKYIDGLPLYRRAGIIARGGVDIDRATLCDWVGRAAWWLAPVAEAIGKHVMAAPVIFTDDTPIRVLAPGNRRTKTGRIWTYVVDERPWAGDRPPAALYLYSQDRKGERPASHMCDFTGFIHADGYAGYEALTRSKAPPGQSRQRIVHAACWAHARRKLYDVHQKTRSPIAAEGLRRVGALYAIERDINGLPPEHRGSVRAERSLPLLADLRIWMDTQRRRLSSKTDLAKALQYALGRWDALARFTTDGRLAIDNNAAERALRGIAVTRKNFLFLGSDKGGERAAIIYTALETARLNGIDPEAWLADVLDQLARGRSQRDLDPLIPWNWQKLEALAIAA